MNKKLLLLLGIGFIAITAVSCKTKNIDNKTSNTTDSQSKIEADVQSDDKKENTKDLSTGESAPTDENDESNHNSEEEDSNRKSTYHDVDIKVPSVHE